MGAISDPLATGDTFDPALVTWVLDDEQMPALAEAVERATEVVIDLETTGLDEFAGGQPWRNGGVPARVVLASLTLPTGDWRQDPSTWVVPLSHPDSPFVGCWRTTLRLIARMIKRAGHPVTNQNLKFDDKWIGAHVGIDLGPLVSWDTQISSHLLDENESTRLKDRAPKTFDIPPWDDFDLTVPGAAEKVPLFDLGMYAARDTYWTWRLAIAHRTLMNAGPQADPGWDPIGPEEVESARLGQLATWCAMPAVATLTSIEQRGIRLDLPWTRNLLDRLNSRAAELQAQVVDRYPLDLPAGTPVSFAATSRFFTAWTKAAVEAGDLEVVALTPQGRPQWSRQVLGRQARNGSAVAQTLIDHRKASKAAEFLTSWTEWVDPDGRIRTTYHAGRVLTGRTSSSDPNMQQVTASLKPAFIPSDGYLIAELDHSQIELRCAAMIAPCEPMLQAFWRGEDLHRILAANIAQIEPDQVTWLQRKGAKPANFGLLYGMGAAGFQDYAENNYQVFYTIEEAEEIRGTFFSLWDGLTEWHAREVARCQRTGQVVSPIGRVRRLPEIWDGNDRLASHAERQAINSPVQSLASDILLIGAAAVEGNLPGYDPIPGVRVVGTIHDSLVVEVLADDWKRLCARTMRRMLDIEGVLARLGCTLTVPLAIEAKVGTRWGTADVATIT